MTVDGQEVHLGNAELRARTGDSTYVAPSLLPREVKDINSDGNDHPHLHALSAGPGQLCSSA
jgi:hypothetical protein